MTNGRVRILLMGMVQLVIVGTAFAQNAPPDRGEVEAMMGLPSEGDLVRTFRAKNEPFAGVPIQPAHVIEGRRSHAENIDIFGELHRMPFSDK